MHKCQLELYPDPDVLECDGQNYRSALRFKWFSGTNKEKLRKLRYVYRVLELC